MGNTDEAIRAFVETAPSTVFRTARPVSLTFLAANVQTEVRHLLGEIPDGMLVIYCGGLVQAEPGVPWTKDVAYLRCNTANAAAIILFVALREAPRDVNS